MNLALHLETLRRDPASSAVTGIAKLLPSAKPSVSYTGVRLFTHDAYTGSAHLDDLAQLYLDKGSFKHGLPLKARLEHTALSLDVETLYKRSDDTIANTWVTWFFTFCREFRLGCACCAGVMAAKIGFKHGAEAALEFSPDEFQQLWPNTRPVGRNYYGRNKGETLMASRAMLEEAAIRLQSDGSESASPAT